MANSNGGKPKKKRKPTPGKTNGNNSHQGKKPGKPSGSGGARAKPSSTYRNRTSSGNSKGTQSKNTNARVESPSDRNIRKSKAGKPSESDIRSSSPSGNKPGRSHQKGKRKNEIRINPSVEREQYRSQTMFDKDAENVLRKPRKS